MQCAPTAMRDRGYAGLLCPMRLVGPAASVATAGRRRYPCRATVKPWPPVEPRRWGSTAVVGTNGCSRQRTRLPPGSSQYVASAVSLRGGQR